MASMDDLIATISGGMHVGQQANDLKDLHAKLQQTLQPPPAYRPIHPYAAGSPSASSAAASSGPQPPPAPPSSWNESAPAGNAHLFSAFDGALGNSPRQGARAGPGLGPGADAGQAGAGAGSPVAVQAGAGHGTAPAHAHAQNHIAFVGRRETGFNVPAPANGHAQPQTSHAHAQGAHANSPPHAASPARASSRHLGTSGFGHGQL
ncbi:3-keto-steroid reductase [Cryptotrichosporon argae]